MLIQYWINVSYLPGVDYILAVARHLDYIPINTKHLYIIWTMLDQDVEDFVVVGVQMLCKCFVFAGTLLNAGEDYDNGVDLRAYEQGSIPACCR